MLTTQPEVLQIGNDEEALRTVEQTKTQMVDAIVAKRADQWKAVIESELQGLITQASNIRQQITTAKTQTKKKYFQKKFIKVSMEVRQMIAALQRVQQTTAIENGNQPTAPAATN